MRRLLLASCFSVLGSIATAQCVLVDVGGVPYPNEISDGYKLHRVVTCGDIDGDGFGELAIGAPLSVLVQGPGVVWLISATDGSIVSRLPDPSAAPTGVGRTVANLGNLLGDARPELATGFADSGSAPLGAVGIFRTDTASPTLVMAMQEPSWIYNKLDIAAAGDVTGDGVPDVLIGALLGTNTKKARVDLRNGVTGALVRSFLPGPEPESSSTTSQFGIALAGAADVDGDGVPDVAVGSPMQGNPVANGKGAVRLYSGATGALIRVILPTQLQSGFGRDVAFVGDVNLDGVSDLVVASDGALSAIGVGHHAVTLVSGASGQVIRGHAAPFYGSTMTGAVRAVGDVNADGVPDYAATTHDSTVGNALMLPLAIVWSGADGSRLSTSALLPQVGQGSREYGDVAAIDDRNGDGKPEIALLITQGSAPNPGRLNVVTMPAGRVVAAEAGDGCEQPWPMNFGTTALIIAGCVEAGGSFHLVDRSAHAGPPWPPLFLLVSANLGSTPIDGACALQLGLPLFVFPAGQAMATIPVTLPPGSGPFQIHVESVRPSGSGFATSGANTLIVE